MVSPGRFISGRGCRLFGKRTRKPNSVYAVIPLGAALPRTLISDLPGGFGDYSGRLAASGRCATGAWLLAPVSLPIWSCSVWGLPCLRHYCRSGALLPHLFTLTRTGRPGVRPSGQSSVPKRGLCWRYVFCGTSRPRALKPASRTLSGTLPCGVRTFLSRQPLLAQGLPAATARSSCQP